MKKSRAALVVWIAMLGVAAAKNSSASLKSTEKEKDQIAAQSDVSLHFSDSEGAISGSWQSDSGHPSSDSSGLWSSDSSAPWSSDNSGPLSSDSTGPWSSNGSPDFESGFKPVSAPELNSAESEQDVKTITITKNVPVPYPVVVEKKVPYKVEIPVDKPYPVYVPKPYNVYVEKKVPYQVQVPIPKPYTVEKHVPFPVRIHVEKPYPVQVPHPYPVFMVKKIPFPVEKQVPVPVKIPYVRPYPVHIQVEKQIPVPVEKEVPYPVRIEVARPVPVHVEKPVPVEVEKLVPFEVEKVVHVPYKVPVPIPITVPVPEPYVTHDTHQPSGSAQEEQLTIPSSHEPHSEHAQWQETHQIANVASGDSSHQQSPPDNQQGYSQLIRYTHSQSHSLPSSSDQGIQSSADQQSRPGESTHHEGQQIRVYFPRRQETGRQVNTPGNPRQQVSRTTRKEHKPQLGRIVVAVNENYSERLKGTRNAGQSESYSSVNLGKLSYSNNVQHK